MGTYLNPSSFNFQRCLNSQIYIDKSMLIAFTNKVLGTEQGFVCVSRPRRFGKTMAADMLAAYYGCEANSDSLFSDLRIAADSSYKKYLNHFDVIKIDMQSFLNKGKDVPGLLNLLTSYLVDDLTEAYPHVRLRNRNDFAEVLNNIFSATGRQFVILIDEWDCVMRRIREWSQQKMYLDFLRDFLKNQPYVALAYMTGILPIKKYGEHSTLNMFKEYSMIDSAEISPYFGFTESEVEQLCDRFHMDIVKLKEWYDGYHLISNAGGKQQEYSIYSPNSIVEAMLRGKLDAYWNQTETYEALKVYIQLNLDGLKDSIIKMLSGACIAIDTGVFKNDMAEVHSRDEALTLLVHLGYLAYDQIHGTVSIPNKEVSVEFVRSINNSLAYREVADSIKSSKDLLEALWNEDSETVSTGVEAAHLHFPSIHYNNENSLSCVIELAFYYAREYYTIVREFPSGKGFADVCFLPKPNHTDKPAIIIELKWSKSADSAIKQIKNRKYPDRLKAYQGNLLLCGISYDKDNSLTQKRHSCVIERFEKHE